MIIPCAVVIIPCAVAILFRYTAIFRGEFAIFRRDAANILCDKVIICAQNERGLRGDYLRSPCRLLSVSAETTTLSREKSA